MPRKIGLTLLVSLLMLANNYSARAANVFTNPGFENPASTAVTVRLIPDTSAGGWRTSHPQSSVCGGGSLCRPIEFWSSGFNSVIAAEGSQFIELSAERAGFVYQVIQLAPGDKLAWSFLHRGRLNATSTDVAEFRIGIPGGLPAGSLPADAYSISIVRVSTTASGAVTAPPAGSGTINPPVQVGNGWVRYSGTYTYTDVARAANVGFLHVSSPILNQGFGNFLDAANLEITREDGCCDKMKVTPFIYNELDQSGRTFEIYNLKAPASDICSIDISFTPTPTGNWTGGGLWVFNGTSLLSSPGLFTLPYQRIPKTGNIAGKPSPTVSSPSVKFNLGIDYTVPYNGTVNLKVNHCDGSRCELAYNPWVVEVGLTATDGPWLVDFRALTADLTEVVLTYGGGRGPVRQSRAGARAKWLGVNLLDDAAEIYSTDGVEVLDERASRQSKKFGLSSSSKSLRAALFEFSGVLDLNSRGEQNGRTISLLVRHKEGVKLDPKQLRLTLYDENANAIISGARQR